MTPSLSSLTLFSPSPFPGYRTKKDYSTAIMDRKKAPHKLSVEDSKQDDNSIVEMTQAKMDELKIFRGDAVILKGKKHLSRPLFLDCCGLTVMIYSA